MNQTLDDIIRNKRLVSRGGGMKPKFNTVRNTGGVGATKKLGRAMQTKTSPVGPAPSIASRLGDARMKIIAKKRQNLVDARDQLNEIARQGDAREKLIMIRAKKTAGNPGKPKSLFTKALGGLKKSPVNNKPGAQGFVTKRQKKPVPLKALTRTVYQDVEPRNYLQIGRLGQSQSLHDIDVDAYNDLDAVERRPSPRSSRERLPDYDELLAMYARNKLQRAEPQPLRRTASTSQPLFRKSSSSGMRMDQYYKADSEEGEEEEIDDMEIEEEHPPSRSKFVSRTIQAKPQSSNMFRRVQQSSSSASASRSHTSYKKTSQAGYRVRISNLAASVTKDDIMELFSDPGPLYSWDLLHGGIAEVYYKKRDDAINAVDVYHKRLLDGQPMAVTFYDQH
ncbi:uncharacterized protein LOC135944743 isoform X2 [Cloeon dipterum]|uniref:uncharacterized protein LOC135944743 isoform X2 n=1 Tax=Cloeon dipterum TaxID=197152 RepID=UPI0032200F2C